MTILIIMLLTLLAGCGEPAPYCPTPAGSPQYLVARPEELATSTPAVGPFTVEFGSKNLQVDKVVEGALCNDNWSGTVYVACDVQVYAWEENPLFLKDCQLAIGPQTVVYVAYHSNSAYYNGCSCHTGETPTP